MAEDKKGNGAPVKPQKIVTSPAEPFSALEEIQERAPARGKVAMIERGAKEAKVIDMSKKATKSKTKAKTKAKVPKAKKKPFVTQGNPEAIPISQEAIEDVREAQAEVESVHLEMGRNTALFFSTVKQLDEKLNQSQENFKATIRRLRKKVDAPEHYVLNLDQWVFIPNPNAQQQPMMQPPPPPANN